MLELRDVLNKYTLFFVDKHDGNLSLGSAKISGEFNRRLFLLTNLKYSEYSSLSSGFINTQMRNNFLSSNEENFRKIKMYYPNYKFLITESIHNLNFPIIKKGEFYNLYEIK